MHDLLKDKTLKAKQKSELLTEKILQKEVSVHELVKSTEGLKEAEITVIMESIEFATRENKQFATQEVFDFAVKYIEAATPALRRESGRVVGNTASISMRNIDKAVSRLLVNSEDPGTVVRWSAAYALAQIFKLGIHELPHLRETLEAIERREEKNSIKKIYNDAIRKYGK